MLGETVVCAAISPQLYILSTLYRYTTSVTCHSHSCTPTSGISEMGFVVPRIMLASNLSAQRFTAPPCKTVKNGFCLLVPPGPIDNSRIMVYRNGQHQLRLTADYGQLSPDMWNFLHSIYGGGPEAVIRQRALSSSQSSTTVSSSSSPLSKGW